MNIKIKNLTKIYPDGHKALNSLNLEIEPGMFGLLGPNGAGKTSLMRIMTLLQNPSSGTILFDDYDILRDRKAIRSILGYLPQDFRFFEKLKTWEFLDYGAGLAVKDALRRLFHDKVALTLMIILGIILFMSIVMPMISQYTMSEICDSHNLGLMSKDVNGNLHILGTDNLGRDSWTRL